MVFVAVVGLGRFEFRDFIVSVDYRFLGEGFEFSSIFVLWGRISIFLSLRDGKFILGTCEIEGCDSFFSFNLE